MIKYEIFTDRFEFRHRLDYYTRDDFNTDLSTNTVFGANCIGSFDTLEDAENYFNENIVYIDTWFTKGITGQLVNVDYMTLEENEYEEECFIQGNVIKDYIKEIPNPDDE